MVVHPLLKPIFGQFTIFDQSRQHYPVRQTGGSVIYYEGPFSINTTTVTLKMYRKQLVLIMTL